MKIWMTKHTKKKTREDMNKIKKEEHWIYLEPDKTSFALRQELLEWLVSKGWHLAYIKFEEDKVTLKIARTSEEKHDDGGIIAKEDIVAKDGQDNTIHVDAPQDWTEIPDPAAVYRRIEAVEERMKKIEEKIEDMNSDWRHWWNYPQWPYGVPTTSPSNPPPDNLKSTPGIPWLQPIYASDPGPKYTDVLTGNPNPYKSKVTCTYNVNC